MDTAKICDQTFGFDYAYQIEQERNYNVWDWFKKAFFANYANFRGRAKRAEFWSFLLVIVLLHYLMVVGSLYYSLFFSYQSLVYYTGRMVGTLAMHIVFFFANAYGDGQTSARHRSTTFG